MIRAGNNRLVAAYFYFAGLVVIEKIDGDVSARVFGGKRFSPLTISDGAVD
jgi:hypothetical protein